MSRSTAHDRLVRLATAYDDATDDDTVTFELPEDLSTLSADELDALRQQAVDAFDALYGSEEAPSEETVATMEALADATDAIREETARRDAQAEQNRADADSLASRVRGDTGDTDDGDGGEPVAEADDEPAEEPVEAVAASGRRITVSGVRARQARRAEEAEQAAQRRPRLVASADLGGLTAGAEVSVGQLAEQLIRRTQGMTGASYRAAFAAGRRQRSAIGLGSVVKSFDPSLVASADNGQEVMDRAVDQSRLPGGSLTASGWCSPSETVYDLFEVEGTDGLVSVPEFQVSRGGIRWTPGPDFATLYGDTGFSFTEEQAIDGEYAVDGQGEPEVGDKPAYRVDCPEFEEERLSVTGLAITAGILQNRAYPEVTSRTIRGALVAHQHRLATQTIAAIAADSDAVAMPADQVGAVAPLLSAIELQSTHYRYVHRLPDSATIEVILPRWVRPVVRADLARRLGVDLLSVPDARIAAYLAERGVAPQFVFNYQDLTGDADGFTSWPTAVELLMYVAGTWTRGTSDVITLEAIFDSELLKINDFSALFTEEGWLLAKRGHDSRKITVPICPSGAVAGGVLIDCDGSEGAYEPPPSG